MHRGCHYYNWGGCYKRGYPSYPREYGARCEYHNTFFSQMKDNEVKPNCNTCVHYKKREKKND